MEFIYYVMPFIDGETLRDKLNRETQLSIDEAVKITTDVADALDYAHRHSVISPLRGSRARGSRELNPAAMVSRGPAQQPAECLPSRAGSRRFPSLIRPRHRSRPGSTRRTA